MKSSPQKKSQKRNIKTVVTLFVLIGAVLIINGLVRGFDIPYPFYQKSTDDGVQSLPHFENPADVLILKEGNATEEGLLSLMQEAMTSSSIEVDDSEEFTYFGCILNATYHGITYGKDYYARMESVYKKGSSEEDCKKIDAQAIYAETYFVDDTLYNRQTKLGEFDVLTSGSQVATAHIPFNYTANLLGNLKEFSILSTSITDSEIRVETHVEKNGLDGTYIFHLDNETLALKALDYEVKSPDSSSSRGTFTLTWNPKPITKP